MRIRELAGVVAIACVVTAPVWAKPPKDRGANRQESAGEHAKKAGKTVANETVDAVTDELVGTSSANSTTAMPPGLAKKDKLPPGLAKKDKTPPGWDKGRKEGWKEGEAEKKEGLIRRMIKGIFKRPAKTSP